jgi:hypothetical protein
MDSIFNIGIDELGSKIDIDSLYESKKARDLGTLTTFKLVLSRVHGKIKTLSRVRNNDECCWYLVPEVIIGLPRFDTASCIAYLIHQLKENGFKVRYTHPNLLLISWDHWTPDYVRAEFKKRTGIVIDGLGNRKVKQAKETDIKTTKLVKTPTSKAISSYAPTGKLVYNSSHMPKIQLR